jgi:cytochrome c peroxidase
MSHHRLLLGLAGVVVALGIGTALGSGQGGKQDESTPPEPPQGLPPVFWPDDNPYSAEKVALGRLLYFDLRLSSDETVSCASCHAPAQAFTDGLPFSLGILGQKGGRSAPTVINRAYTTLQFWDGRARTLEEQAKGPLANPLEMTSIKEENQAHTEVVQRVREIPGYAAKFRAVFGEGPITIDAVAKAIATFERTVLSGNSAFDRYKAGEKSALSDSQLRGMKVFFNKAQCDSCHLGFNFSDESFMNIGVGMDKPNPDLGRFAVSKREADKGAFKTPTLREVAQTAPYMHDGSMRTLEEVVEHYNKGGIKNPWLSQQIKPLNLTEQEKKDLVEFLKGLNGSGWQQIKPPTNEEFPR